MCRSMSRLANLFQIVLVGLPILGFVQFLGGVDPNQVLFGFAFTMLIMLSAGGVSIYASSRARTHVKALVTSYLLILLFIAPLACVLPSVLGNRGTFSFSSALFVDYDSPLMIFFILIGYLLYHGSIAYRCYRLAVSELRDKRREAWTPTSDHGARATKDSIKSDDIEKKQVPEGSGSNEKSSTRRSRSESSGATRNQERRCPVADDAMLWKELEVRDLDLWDKEWNLFLLALAIGAPIGLCYTLVAIFDGEYQGEFSNSIVRLVGTILTCLSAMIVALSASRRVSREYEQQTLESLLTTPHEPFDILYAKWLGSIWAARWTVCAIVPFWVFGVLSGGLHVFALPLVLAGFLVQVAFLASLGLWFSVTNRSTIRATLFTLLASLVIVLRPGLLIPVVYGATTEANPSWQNISWSMFFLDYGLSFSAQA